MAFAEKTGVQMVQILNIKLHRPGVQFAQSFTQIPKQATI